MDELFRELRLPPPGKTSNVLVSLEKKGWARRSDAYGVWMVTQVGRAHSEQIVGSIDLAVLAAEAETTGTRLGGAAHSVVLPEFGAPPALLPVLRDFLADHEFDRNVFGMTRFPGDDDEEAPDPVKSTLQIAAEVCAAHGLELHLASDRQMHDELWTNVTAHMWASRYGIALFEDLADPKRGLNYNLTIEVGSMLMTGRRCALLKDRSIAGLPTDLVGQIYKAVDMTKPKTVEKALHAWVRDDLALGACKDCAVAGR